MNDVDDLNYTAEMEITLADNGDSGASLYGDVRKYGRDKSVPQVPKRSISEYVREFEW